MSSDQGKNIYREKAAAMRAQVARAQSDSLRMIYQQIAEQWALQADTSDGEMDPDPGKVAN
jgi:hypothetical protein